MGGHRVCPPTFNRGQDDQKAVLLFSLELDEIMALADRIAVMYEGKIVGVVDRDEATEEMLGLMMAGIENSKAAVAAEGGEDNDQKNTWWSGGCSSLGCYLVGGLLIGAVLMIVTGTNPLRVTLHCCAARLAAALIF